MKTCSKCSIEKPLTEFSKDKRAKSGFYCACKTCQNTFNKAYRDSAVGQKQTKAYGKSYRDSPEGKAKRKAWTDSSAGKEARRNHNLKTNYGITQQEYLFMYKQQEGICPGCDKYFLLLSIDHCHNTLKVRGLLCNSCNVALGYADDKVSILKNLIEYLEYYEQLANNKAGLSSPAITT